MSTSTAPAPVEVDAKHGADLLRQMLLIRRFEEKCVELYSATKIRGFMHLYSGEEATGVGTMQPLRPQDRVVATYREHGHALARGMSARTVMAEMFGKLEGCSHGRGGSMHLFDAATNFYGGNAIVGGGLPIAVGMALADKMRGNDVLTACYFGDGAVAEGVFHESLNLAALWRLPVLFYCENNLYAMGTPLERAQKQTDLTLKAKALGMPAEAVDGMDVLAVEAAARNAVATMRDSGGPAFLELRTYRFRAHSMYDPDLYRSKAEIDRWKRRDPVATFSDLLQQHGLLTAAEVTAMEHSVAAEIADAVDFAEAGAFEPVEDLERFVYSEAAR